MRCLVNEEDSMIGRGHCLEIAKEEEEEDMNGRTAIVEIVYEY